MNIALMPLALVHRACPLCWMARMWPGSPVARIRAGIAKGCPFCLADGKIRSETSRTIKEKGGEEDAVG